MSLTFTYSFTISQDFCARKGNTTFLYTTWRYWMTQQYNGLEMLICIWNAFAILSKDHHPFLLGLFSRRVLKGFYYKFVSQHLPLTKRFHPKIRLVFLPASALSRVHRFLESRLVEGWNRSDSRTSSNRIQESSGTHLVQQCLGATWCLCLLILTKRNDDQQHKFFSVDLFFSAVRFFSNFFCRLVSKEPCIL